jgi:hypothetical protein
MILPMGSRLRQITVKSSGQLARDQGYAEGDGFALGYAPVVLDQCGERSNLHNSMSDIGAKPTRLRDELTYGLF